jgi:hypothetical protein
MKFDSTAMPSLPTPQQLTEFNDLLLSATELYKIYATLERHPRIISSSKSLELFDTYTAQLHQDISILDEQLEDLLLLSRAKPASDSGQTDQNEAIFAQGSEGDAPYPFLFIPDVEPTDVKKSVFDIVRKSFQIEDLFREQLKTCLAAAQSRRHLKLELQLKMIILSADQRYRLLEDRYGYAKSKSVLFQGLRRQTTRFLSALSGEKRTDIDR